MSLRNASPAVFSAALRDAQVHFVPDAPKSPKFIALPRQSIHLRPELFQPREFTCGWDEVDPEHTKLLAQEIELKGALDPILVLKLGDQWTCVDGHHRLAAYGEDWPKPLKCERFKGSSLWEAIGQSLHRNSVHQLPLSNADRQEMAWKHVLFGNASIKQTTKLCGVSARQVSYMRKVKQAWDDKGAMGKSW